MQAKIRELYKASQQSQQQESTMMNPNGGQIPGYPSNIQYALNMMAGAAYGGNDSRSAAALALQGRNPYTTGAASGYPVQAQQQMMYGNPYGNLQQAPSLGSRGHQLVSNARRTSQPSLAMRRKFQAR